MKTTIQLLFLIGIVSSLSAQNSLKLKGFGEIQYTKGGDAYTLNLENYGSFDFKGTLNPLALESTLSIDQLTKVPGYEVIKELELEEIKLKLKNDSLQLEGKAATDKKLNTLAKALNIEAPYIQFYALLSKNGMQLEANLNFSKDPVLVEVSKEIGTRMMLDKIGIGGNFGTGKNSPKLKVFANTKMRPTEKDPDLTTTLELSYNLLTQELTGTGAMTDNWVDPLGMSGYIRIKEDAVAIKGAAVSLGWIPAAPMPTTIAFAIEKAQFFELEYLTQMSIAPAKQQVALKATQKEVSSENFTKMLEEGFGLKLPKNLFPEEMIIKDAELLFSPSGGQVADQKIEKGFAYKGGLEISDSLLSGDLAFMAKNKEEISLDVDLHAEEMYNVLAHYLGDGKENKLNEALENALSNLEIEKMYTHLEADKNMKMSGNTHCELILFGKEVKFKLKASLNPNDITKGIIAKIGALALEQLKDKKK